MKSVKLSRRVLSLLLALALCLSLGVPVLGADVFPEEEYESFYFIGAMGTAGYFEFEAVKVYEVLGEVVPDYYLIPKPGSAVKLSVGAAAFRSGLEEDGEDYFMATGNHPETVVPSFDGSETAALLYQAEELFEAYDEEYGSGEIRHYPACQ